MDAANLLFGAMWMVLVGGVVVVAFRALGRRPRRPTRRAALAEELGFAYAPDDAQRVAGIPVAWLSGDRYRGIEATIWGIWRDRPVTVVDIRVVRPDDDPLPSRERDLLPADRWYGAGRNQVRTAVLVDHGLDVPNVRLIDHPKSFEPDEVVEDRFALVTGDRLFAELLLAPTFRSVLRSLPRGTRVEIAPRWLLVGMDTELPPRRMRALLDDAIDVLEAMPAEVGEWRRA